jgi:hypothetical protein
MLGMDMPFTPSPVVRRSLDTTPQLRPSLRSYRGRSNNSSGSSTPRSLQPTLTVDPIYRGMIRAFYEGAGARWVRLGMVANDSGDTAGQATGVSNTEPASQ